MMGTDYNDFIATNPYQAFDSTRIPYGFPMSKLKESLK